MRKLLGVALAVPVGAFALLIGTLVSKQVTGQGNPALSQVRTYGIFTPTARAPNSSVSNSSTRVALGASAPVAWICNTGATDAYVKLGNSAVVATTTADTLIRSGICIQMDATAATNLASITASSTTTLVTSLGMGSVNAALAVAGSGGGGGGGAVTVADGADTVEGTTTDAACAGDATSGCTLLSRVSRVAARLTTLIAQVPATLTAAGADAVSNTLSGLQTYSRVSIFNGTTWDRLLGDATNGAFVNVKTSVLPTGGATAANQSTANASLASIDTKVGSAVPAGDLHIGEIGSNQIKVQVAQTVTAGAYAAGNALGGLMTIANASRVSGSAGAAGTGGILAGLQLNSKALQTGVQVDIFVFDANPTGSTCTDKSAFVLANADFDKVVGILTIPSTAANGAGWFGATTTGSVGIPTYYPVTYDLASATSIYACAVVRAAITPAATTDISFKYNLLRN